MFRADLKKFSIHLLITLFLLPSGLAGQEAQTPPLAMTIPNGTPVEVRLLKTVNSALAHIGNPLDFVVIKDVAVGGLTIIPAGTIAQGSVIGVKGKRFLGMGGNVVFQLDSVELVSGERIPLLARKEVKGGSRTKLMAAAMVATGLFFLPAAPIFLLTRGHQCTVLRDTAVTAHVEADTSIALKGLVPSSKSASQMNTVMTYLPPRVLNGEGREGDMVNLVFIGRSDQLQAAFQRAGWVRTDKWRPVMAWHLLSQRTHDAKLPMARFYMFGRTQDYSYALPDPTAVVSRRHHLRIWKTESEVNGYPIWAGAATHDVAIIIAKQGRLINHSIDPQVDTERDFIGTNLEDTHLVGHREYLHSADPVFEAETASGEAYYSDSRILLLDLHQTRAVNSDLAADVPGYSSSISTLVPASGLLASH